MAFYGIFLMGIMLVYMKTKRRDKESNLLLLCNDEERQWLSGKRTTPALSIPLSLQASSMFSALQENVGPAFSCAACSMEGSSLSSESSTSDVHLTIQEESPEGLLQDVPEAEKDDDKRQIS
ncbi:potassium voltage-gated channel subfamily E member 4 [Xenopus tropicalis]|nr:potassium voltage-gated channel subfamily E member 4 [Xenopus tropicalis]